VLDNVLIHRSKQVQAWLQAHPRMQLALARVPAAAVLGRQTRHR
jgi:hypothetical protein